MPFEKGDPRINRAGRPVGSKNKVAEEIKQAYADVLANKLPDVERWINQTAQENPGKAVDLLMRLSERFLPALQRQEITGADGADLFKNTVFKFGDDINIDTDTDTSEDIDDLL